MATVTKRIAKSGMTIDGRELPKPTLIAMAASYDQQTYAARVNLEHYVSVMPDSPFKEYGTVTALKTEEAPGNEVYLVADMDVLDEVIDWWENKKQKRAFSIELDRNLAGSGKPYLTGLAVTSTPASLGTHFTATDKPDVTRYQFIENRVDDHADFTVEHFTMQKDKAADTSADPVKTGEAQAVPTAGLPEQFTAHLDYYSKELAAVRAERDDLQAEKKKLTADFTAQLAAKDAEFATQLTAKDAEIQALKEQLPAEGYKPRPLFTGNEGSAESHYLF